MTARNYSPLWSASLRITVVLAITFGISAYTQEAKRNSSRVEQVPEPNQQSEGARCDRSPNCVDAGEYTATVTKIFESTTEKSRMVRVILRFENVSDHVIILAYRAQSGFLLDNFRNRYFCSQGGQTGPNAQDNSAVGIGIDRDNKIDPQFMLKPKQSDIASFDLSRSRGINQQATFYDFDVMIDEIDPVDPGIILSHPFLSFRNLQSKGSGSSKPGAGKNHASP
jgi:hypothetical protein